VKPSTRQSEPPHGAWLVALLSVIGGALVARYYYDLGLTLSHYDARGHLVVARRIFDSLTPGWQQIGAVWLPLPHLLNALPAQVDAFYRTGASGVAISVAAFSVATVSIARVVHACTGSSWAAFAACAVFALNPNVLYLQATPMTEPLLIALISLSVWLSVEWCRQPAVSTAGWAGVALALACLTRYEAWPVTGAVLTAALWARWRATRHAAAALREVARIGVYPAVAVVAFLIFSRVVVGQWFVAGGFFVPENESLGDASLALRQVIWGVGQLSGSVLLTIAGVGLFASAVVAIADRDRGHLAVPLALASTAALPILAFYEGHPYRIRYMVPLMAAQAIGVGLLCGLIPGGRLVRILVPSAAMVVAALELQPLDNQAPMVVEAQWDRPNIAARQAVTACVRSIYDGETIMASMGSLGHYMQEMSHAGFSIRDFLHEGNGDIWLSALYQPRPFAGWLLIEEKAEGGDLLAAIARRDPSFLNGYSRICEGAGVALYRRQPHAAEDEGSGPPGPPRS
jgi:hypothetical protein